jgi:hypothetical protein
MLKLPLQPQTENLADVWRTCAGPCVCCAVQFDQCTWLVAARRAGSAGRVTRALVVRCGWRRTGSEVSGAHTAVHSSILRAGGGGAISAVFSAMCAVVAVMSKSMGLVRLKWRSGGGNSHARPPGSFFLPLP